MEIRELALMSPAEVAKLLQGIPFYKDLQVKDADQFRCVVGLSKLVELAPGETIMRSGERGTWLYFLVKGKLIVYPESGTTAPLNEILPGELFGDLAMLGNCERCATVKADPEGKNVQLLATHFARFGSLEDFHLVTLPTKLMLYRMIVHGIRWKLELNRMADAHNPLVRELLRAPLFNGSKNTVEELRFLAQQAKTLAELLISWNAQKGSQTDSKGVFVAPGDTDSGPTVSALLAGQITT